MNKKKLIAIGVAVVILILLLLLLFLKPKQSKTFEIGFNSNGGTQVESVIVKEGELLSKPIDPEKEGYTFIGWMYKDEVYDFSLPVTQDLVLIAKWEKSDKTGETFYITFNTDGGSTVIRQVIKKGEKLTKPANPEKEGYIFIGWFVDGKEFDFNTEITKDLTITARWEKKEEKQPNNTNKNKINTSSTSTKVTNNNSGNDKTTKITNTNDKTLLAPNIKKEFGGGNSEIAGYSLKITNSQMYDIELYKSENANGNYSLMKTISKTAYNGDSGISVIQMVGTKNYYKVRFKDGNNYSNYSNVIEIDNTTSAIEISKTFGGGNPEMSGWLITSSIVLSDIELYKSSSLNGKYELVKTITNEEFNRDSGIPVIQMAGTKNYYKIRLKYNGMYSGYSNVIEIDNTSSVVEISKIFKGGNPEIYGWLITSSISLSDIELYKSSSLEGEYELVKTITNEEFNSNLDSDGTPGISIIQSVGTKSYYKIRLKYDGMYSGYSNILEIG